MAGRRERIREKIAARTLICEESCGVDGVVGPCHVWQGPDSGKLGRGAGYPRMSLDGQTVAVHLVLWTNENGYIPGRKTLDHLCRNRLCINLDHLEMVTMKENAKRRELANGRGKMTRRKRAKKKKKVEPVCDYASYERVPYDPYGYQLPEDDIPF